MQARGSSVAAQQAIVTFFDFLGFRRVPKIFEGNKNGCLGSLKPSLNFFPNFFNIFDTKWRGHRSSTRNFPLTHPLTLIICNGSIAQPDLSCLVVISKILICPIYVIFTTFQIDCLTSHDDSAASATVYQLLQRMMRSKKCTSM